MHVARPGRFIARYGLFALLLALLLAFLVWPILLTVSGAFFSPAGEPTLRYFTGGGGLGVLRDPATVRGLINSLLIAVCTTILCGLIAMPMSVIAARYRFPGKGAVTAVVLVPLILPPFVGAIGIRALLGRFGGVNALLNRVGVIDLLQSMGFLSPTRPFLDFLGGDPFGAPAWLRVAMEPFDAPLDGRFWGVVVMEALHLYPILYLNLTAALANLDPSLEEAALGLGGGRWTRFRRVTLPLIMPGIFAGGTIVFIWSFTELGTPLMFDFFDVTPVQVFWGLLEVESNPRPFALVVVMLAVALVCYLLGKLVLGGRGYAMTGKATVGSTERPLGRWGGLAALALFLTVTLLAVMPHVGVVIESLSSEGAWYASILPREATADHYIGALTHDLAAGSIGNSLLYASLAMVLCVIAGLAMAYLTVRVRVWGSSVLDTLGMLPLAVPGLVMAFGYVAISLRWPFTDYVNSEGETLIPALLSKFRVLGEAPNPILLLVIAYAVRRLPYILRAASAGLEQTSGQLEEAALNLGASRLTAMRRVVVPLIAANLIAGSILVFSFAMLEVSDSLILAVKEEDYPITKAIWALYNRLGDGPYIASAMGVWGMALLTLTLVGASVLMGRKLGAVFRV